MPKPGDIVYLLWGIALRYMPVPGRRQITQRDCAALLDEGNTCLVVAVVNVDERRTLGGKLVHEDDQPISGQVTWCLLLAQGSLGWTRSIKSMRQVTP